MLSNRHTRRQPQSSVYRTKLTVTAGASSWQVTRWLKDLEFIIKALLACQADSGVAQSIYNALAKPSTQKCCAYSAGGPSPPDGKSRRWWGPVSLRNLCFRGGLSARRLHLHRW